MTRPTEYECDECEDAIEPTGRGGVVVCEQCTPPRYYHPRCADGVERNERCPNNHRLAPLLTRSDYEFSEPVAWSDSDDEGWDPRRIYGFARRGIQERVNKLPDERKDRR